MGNEKNEKFAHEKWEKRENLDMCNRKPENLDIHNLETENLDM